MMMLQSEDQSGKCAKLHTVEASNNREYCLTRSLIACLHLIQEYVCYSSRTSRSWWITQAKQHSTREFVWLWYNSGLCEVLAHLPLYITTSGVTREAQCSGHWITERRRRKVPTNSQVDLLPKDLRFENGCAQLHSYPGPHLTSVRPWVRQHIWILCKTTVYIYPSTSISRPQLHQDTYTSDCTLQLPLTLILEKSELTCLFVFNTGYCF